MNVSLSVEHRAPTLSQMVECLIERVCVRDARCDLHIKIVSPCCFACCSRCGASQIILCNLSAALYTLSTSAQTHSHLPLSDGEVFVRHVNRKWQSIAPCCGEADTYRRPPVEMDATVFECGITFLVGWVYGEPHSQSSIDCNRFQL